MFPLMTKLILSHHLPIVPQRPRASQTVLLTVAWKQTTCTDEHFYLHKAAQQSESKGKCTSAATW